MSRTQIDLSVQSQDLTLTNAKIAADQITNDKINSAAAIAISKLNTTSADFDASGNLKSGVVADSEISSSAQIAHSKLANATPGQLLVGTTTTGVVTATTITGDVTVTGAGVTSIGASKVTNAMLAGSIDTSKLAEGADFLQADASHVLVSGVRFTYPSLQEFTNDGDLVSKAYVDGVASGLDLKDSVRLATTAADGNLSLTGAATVDGVAVVDGDRILVKNQTNGAQNGIYVANTSGAWSRSSDADNQPGAEITTGMFAFVTSGSTNANNGFVLVTTGTITLGTTALVFTQFSGAGQVYAGAGLSKTGNTIDVGTGDGIQVDSESITVKLDGSTLTKSASGLKLSDLSSGMILIGNGSNVATAQSISGDVTLLNTGATTVTDLTISGEAAGNLLYFNGSNWVRLSTGTSQQFLRVNSGGTAPEWGSFEDKKSPTRVSSTQYDLAYTPVSGSEHVFVNGILQENGGGAGLGDYYMSGVSIMFNNSIATTDKVVASFRR